MLDPSELRQFFPVVVSPSHDGKFFQNYVTSLLNFAIEAERTGMRMQVLFHQGESLVTRARNNCVAQFLANPNWTHLFWIDADIGFSAQAAFRLLLSGYDIAAGVYPLKRENWPAEGVPAGTTQQQFEATFTRYTVNAKASELTSQVELEVQPDGFMKMTEAPTGFMVIKRAVFERLIASYPDLNYVPDSIGETDQGLHYRFFDVMVDPETRRYLSEDYGFCRLWSGLGESIYIDANSNLSHQGAKMYRGDFASSLLTSLPHAVGGPAGAAMVLKGQEYLQPNLPG
ncbi:hypothetical protein J2W32_001697 [Variovorax boronicumulans]|uniref:Glycosyl transferase n=1 Tax=Variovorax boronicumulans TaxID=436515 RepID=A0AAW8CZ40_9BURK|nr:hypothetical protein [Variovorax boronicumulans]MDP9892998.1 hypothetical protein [Variovorax boronicumulans]MDQ0052655.1 hypothetical protein [Variovorax boronicumulans]